MKSHGFILIVATLKPVFACIVNVPFIYNSRQSGLWDHLTNKYNIHYERHLGIFLECDQDFVQLFIIILRYGRTRQCISQTSQETQVRLLWGEM